MDTETNYYFNGDQRPRVSNPLYAEDGVLQEADPIALDIPDDDLVENIEKRIETSKKFFDSKYSLTERRRRNEMYLFGRQIDDKERKKQLKIYEARYLDNALYEIEASLKPLAMSHLPDMIVLPGSDDPQKAESAQNITIAVDDVNKKRRQRQVLAIGFKHLPVYYTACIKASWNPEKGKDGDYQFDIVHPDYIVFDETATTTNADDMSFVAECQPTTVQDVLMRFPKKKVDFLAELAKVGIIIGESGQPSKAQLASEIKIWQVYFTWYKHKETGEVETDKDHLVDDKNDKWEKIEGVVWKFEDCILKKIKNPNYDYEGEVKYFSYDDPRDENSKKEVKVEELAIAQLMGIPMTDVFAEKIYHNYFQMPRKPYFFFGYDQWGKVAIDETSRIEQNIRNQQNLDTQGKQIIDTLKQRVKHIWSKDAGLRSADVQKMDMDNPNLDALVEGNVNDVHKAIQPERPDAAQFKSLDDTRNRMYGVAGANAIRGELQSDVATTNQIAREADYTRADDLVEDTINAACEWMAEWQMQFIKLRYTAEHLRQILGDKGATTFIRLNRDMVSDGMEVMIKSSSTDKLKAQRNAMEMAKLGPPFIDPLTFFEDMGMSNPKGRAERGFMFSTDPAGYFVKYILEMDSTEAMVEGLNGGTPPVSTPAPQTPPADAIPQNPTMTDTAAVPTAPPVTPQASPRAI